MKSELDVLADVGRRLESLGVPFMLTGSLALAYYAQRWADTLGVKSLLEEASQ